ncbi:membrane lipoprotein lipid attachment site-containing protein [Marinobacteraceae bacterium S3BR75-40.1]
MKRQVVILFILLVLMLTGCSKDRAFWNDGGKIGSDGRKVWDTNGQMQSEEDRKIWDSNREKKENSRKIWENDKGEPVID